MDTTLLQLASLAFEAMPQAAFVAGRCGEVFLRNAAATAALPPGEHMDQVLQAGGPPESLQWRREVEILLEEMSTRVRRNVWVYLKSGRQLLADLTFSRLPIAMSLCRAKREGGRQEPPYSCCADCTCVLVLVQDVSVRASMERRLSASERLAAIGELSQKVAHELNTPLDGVMRYIGLAERTAGDGALRYLNGARGGLVRMTGIIRDLAEQGRIGEHSGQRDLLSRLLEESLSALQPRCQALGVDVRCELAELSRTIVDGHLYHVFCNVIKNALDAMPDGGSLWVRARGFDDRAIIDFEDSGIGLQTGDPEEIFAPFYTTKPPGEGSGLGLAICRELLGRSGGEIAAAPREGGGTRVTIHVPSLRDESDGNLEA